MLPQAPQFSLEFIRSTQALLHCVSGSPAMLLPQATQALAPLQNARSPQLLPQPPQLLGSVYVSAQRLSQAMILGPPPHPHRNAGAAPVPTLLHCNEPGQAAPHALQFARIDRLTSQPLDATPSQSAKGTAHTRRQTPALHSAVPLGPLWHTTPHRPQLRTSLLRSGHRPLQMASSETHRPPHDAIGAGQPLQTPPRQLWPSAHRAPHAPQFWVSLSGTASQPLALSPSQST